MKDKKPGIRFRNQMTIFHHLFKASIGKFLKDISIGQDDLRIDQVEHVHYYHSVNSMGHAQKYTTLVGGHFHEVTWSLDPKTGEPVAKCGPALKKIIKNTPRGQKTLIEPLKFFNKEHNQWIEDNHAHDMSYMGSDELSTAQIQDTQKKNAQMIQAMEPKKSSEVDLIDNDRV